MRKWSLEIGGGKWVTHEVEDWSTTAFHWGFHLRIKLLPPDVHDYYKGLGMGFYFQIDVSGVDFPFRLQLNVCRHVL